MRMIGKMKSAMKIGKMMIVSKKTWKMIGNKRSVMKRSGNSWIGVWKILNRKISNGNKKSGGRNDKKMKNFDTNAGELNNLIGRKIGWNRIYNARSNFSWRRNILSADLRLKESFSCNWTDSGTGYRNFCWNRNCWFRMKGISWSFCRFYFWKCLRGSNICFWTDSGMNTGSNWYGKILRRKNNVWLLLMMIPVFCFWFFWSLIFCQAENIAWVIFLTGHKILYLLCRFGSPVDSSIWAGCGRFWMTRSGNRLDY
jgi:hypothetical protein